MYFNIREEEDPPHMGPTRLVLHLDTNGLCWHFTPLLLLSALTFLIPPSEACSYYVFAVVAPGPSVALSWFSCFLNNTIGATFCHKKKEHA